MNGSPVPEGLRFGGDWPWWTGPPVNEMPAAIAAAWVLVCTPQVSVFLTEADVYSTGVQLTLLAFAPKPDQADDPALIPLPESVGKGDAGDGPRIRLVATTAQIGPIEWMPDLEVAYDDGRVAREVDFQDGERPPPAAALTTLGSSHGPPRWVSRPFLYPIPPRGPMVVRCSWPSRGVEGASCEIDAGVFHDALPNIERLS